MKLYTTVESDKERKAQGGDKWTNIMLRVGDGTISRIVATLRAEVQGDDIALDYSAEPSRIVPLYAENRKGKRPKRQDK